MISLRVVISWNSKQKSIQIILKRPGDFFRILAGVMKPVTELQEKDSFFCKDRRYPFVKILFGFD